MICDKLAAGMAYKKKDFTYQYELDYWNKEKNILQVNEKTEKFITKVFTDIVENGVDKTLNKTNLKNLYKKYCRKFHLKCNKNFRKK